MPPGQRPPAPERIDRPRALPLRVGILAAVLALAAAGACSPGADERYPDVVAVEAVPTSETTFDFAVTISSPHDTPSRYADGFRVVTRQGQVLGERKLAHDHQGEQPFTRDLRSVRIPRHVRNVVVQARDRLSGYGGKSVDLALPGR